MSFVFDESDDDEPPVSLNGVNHTPINFFLDDSDEEEEVPVSPNLTKPTPIRPQNRNSVSSRERLQHTRPGSDSPTRPPPLVMASDNSCGRQPPPAPVHPSRTVSAAVKSEILDDFLMCGTSASRLTSKTLLHLVLPLLHEITPVERGDPVVSTTMGGTLEMLHRTQDPVVVLGVFLLLLPGSSELVDFVFANTHDVPRVVVYLSWLTTTIQAMVAHWQQDESMSMHKFVDQCRTAWVTM